MVTIKITSPYREASVAHKTGNASSCLASEKVAMWRRWQGPSAGHKNGRVEPYLASSKVAIRRLGGAPQWAKKTAVAPSWRSERWRFGHVEERALAAGRPSGFGCPHKGLALLEIAGYAKKMALPDLRPQRHKLVKVV